MQQALLHEPNGKPLIDVKDQPLTPIRLLQLALQNNAAIDVIERLAALERDARAEQAAEEFNEAMNKAQAAVQMVIPDLKNDQANKKYESYKALDKEIRPIYLQHGFSLSFGFGDAPTGFVRVICHVTRGSHTRMYQGPDYPADGSGPKGGGVLTPENATTGAASRGRRQLLKFIFNIVVGEEDTGTTFGELAERLEWIENCRTLPELKKVYLAAANEALDKADKNALKVLKAAKEKKEQQLQ